MPSPVKSTLLRDAQDGAIGFGRWAGLIAGFVLPVIAAMLFRTYHLAVVPKGLESARQLGTVYLIGEMVVVLYARRQGLHLRKILHSLPPWARIALAIFLVTFWISSAFVSQMIPFSLGLSLGWIVHLLFAASIYHLARLASHVDARDIAGGFVAGLVALTAFIVLQFAAVPAVLLGHTAEIAQHGGIDLGSAIPGFISIRLFGSWCGAILALLTGIAWQHNETRGRHALYMMLALALGLTVWTATRAALLGWGIGLPVAWALAGRPASSATYTRLPFYLVGAITIALLLPPYGNGQFTFLRWGSLASSDAVTSGRLTFWTSALRVIGDHPLLGSGAGSSWWLIPLNGFYHVQPHNAVIQFFLNWGLIPTIPALILLTVAAWYSHSIARRQHQLLPIILMLDCLLMMSLFDGMLHFAQFVMLIFGCVALCLSQGEKVYAS